MSFSVAAKIPIVAYMVSRLARTTEPATVNQHCCPRPSQQHVDAMHVNVRGWLDFPNNGSLLIPSCCASDCPQTYNVSRHAGNTPLRL